MMAYRRFKMNELARVASAESFQDEREPMLRIGDIVRLNSGGPVLLIVDVGDGEVTAASGDVEVVAAVACFHRVRDVW